MGATVTAREGSNVTFFGCSGARANVTIEGVPLALLAAEPPPHLGVTVLQLEGLEQAAVTILVGLLGELPGEVRLLPVPESETSGI